MWHSMNPILRVLELIARYTYPIEVAIGEKTSTTSDGWPGTLPATFRGLFQWWKLGGVFGRWFRALLREIRLWLR